MAIVKALDSETRPAERATLMKGALEMIAAGERLKEGAEWFSDFYVARGEKIGDTLRAVEEEVRFTNMKFLILFTHATYSLTQPSLRPPLLGRDAGCLRRQSQGQGGVSPSGARIDASR